MVSSVIERVLPAWCFSGTVGRASGNGFHNSFARRGPDSVPESIPAPTISATATSRMVHRVSSSASVPGIDTAHLPRLPPGFDSRPRLVELCDDLAAAELLVVRAPAGSGKTSHLTDWARHRSAVERIVWVSLDQGGNLTAPLLWNSIARALKRSGFDGDGHGAASTAADLNGCAGPVRVVIDALDVDDASIASELIRLASLLRRGGLVVATRAVGTPGSALLDAQVRVATVTAADLAFTAKETQRLIRKHCMSAAGEPSSVGRTALAAEEIHRFSGGHTLLTRLIVSSGSSTLTEVALVAADWARTVIGAERIEFAARISLARTVDASLAHEITRAEHASATLDGLADDGLGTIDHDGFFCFHDLIGSTLRRHAGSTLPDELLRRTQSVAADYLRTRPEHSLTAFRLLAEAGRTTELWPFLVEHFTTLTNEPDTVRSALVDISDDVVIADGTLGAIAAITQSMRESSPPSIGLRDLTSVALHELRTRPPATDGEEAVLRDLAILGLLLAVHDHDAATGHAEQLERHINTLSPVQRLQLSPALGLAHLVVATTHTLAGDMYEAERVLGSVESDRTGHNALRRHIQHAYICAMRGEVTTASAIIEEHIDRRPRSIPWSSRLALAQAIILLENGQLTNANEMLRSLEPHLTTAPDWANILFVITRAQIATDPGPGIEHVDGLLTLHGSRPTTAPVRDLIDSGIADLALAAGDVPRAMKLVERRTADDVALRVAAARIGLVTGDLGYIDDLRDLVSQTNVWTRRRVHALFLLAVGLHRAGSQSQSHDALRRARAIARKHGIRLIQSLVPRAELDIIAAQAGLDMPRNVNGADPLADLLPPVRLTKREKALLQQLATGALLREIADAEFVTLSTIKSRAANLYRKLGVHGRHDAVDVARQRGAVP